MINDYQLARLKRSRMESWSYPNGHVHDALKLFAKEKEVWYLSFCVN